MCAGKISVRNGHGIMRKFLQAKECSLEFEIRQTNANTGENFDATPLTTIMVDKNPPKLLHAPKEVLNNSSVVTQSPVKISMVFGEQT